MPFTFILYNLEVLFVFCSVFGLFFFCAHTNQKLNFLQHAEVSNISKRTISECVQLYFGCLRFQFSELSKS